MADVDQLTVRNQAVLKAAPKKVAALARPGTTVRVHAHDALIPRSWPSSVRTLLDPVSPDHMYVEHDDGREQFIARGGPAASGLALVRDAMAGDRPHPLQVRARLSRGQAPDVEGSDEP